MALSHLHSCQASSALNRVAELGENPSIDYSDDVQYEQLQPSEDILDLARYHPVTLSFQDPRLEDLYEQRCLQHYMSILDMRRIYIHAAIIAAVLTAGIRRQMHWSNISLAATVAAHATSIHRLRRSFRLYCRHRDWVTAAMSTMYHVIATLGLHVWFTTSTVYQHQQHGQQAAAAGRDLADETWAGFWYRLLPGTGVLALNFIMFAHPLRLKQALMLQPLLFLLHSLTSPGRFCSNTIQHTSNGPARIAQLYNVLRRLVVPKGMLVGSRSCLLQPCDQAAITVSPLLQCHAVVAMVQLMMGLLLSLSLCYGAEKRSRRNFLLGLYHSGTIAVVDSSMHQVQQAVGGIHADSAAVHNRPPAPAAAGPSSSSRSAGGAAAEEVACRRSAAAARVRAWLAGVCRFAAAAGAAVLVYSLLLLTVWEALVLVAVVRGV